MPHRVLYELLRGLWGLRWLRDNEVQGFNYHIVDNSDKNQLQSQQHALSSLRSILTVKKGGTLVRVEARAGLLLLQFQGIGALLSTEQQHSILEPGLKQLLCEKSLRVAFREYCSGHTPEVRIVSIACSCYALFRQTAMHQVSVDLGPCQAAPHNQSRFVNTQE